MAYHQSSAIKRAQKESQLQQEISKLLHQLMLDDHRLQGLFVNRVKLSPDKSICTVYFYTANGQTEFEEKLGSLILYKPSLRKAIAQIIPAKYVPEFVFKFDEQFEKQKRIDELLAKIKDN
jgi:ribosome-binding factor A